MISVLSIYREAKDSYRVFMLGVVILLVSHYVYLYESTADNISIVHTSDILLILVFWGIVADRLLWCLVSGSFDSVLYLRFFIIACSTALVHRFFYGVETAGSFFYNTIFLIFTTPWIPFAIFGWDVILKSSIWLRHMFSKVFKKKIKLSSDNVLQYQKAGAND